MSHFIILTASMKVDAPECTYRIRADRIDWMADRHTASPMSHTVVSVNGTELQVEEPVHVILTYIKDPTAPILGEDQYERNPNVHEYMKKHGDKEGIKRYLEVLHCPGS